MFVRNGGRGRLVRMSGRIGPCRLSAAVRSNRNRFYQTKIQAPSLVKQRNSPIIQLREALSPVACSSRKRPRAAQGVFVWRENRIFGLPPRPLRRPRFLLPHPPLLPASPPAPARTPCRALLGPRPLIRGEDGHQRAARHSRLVRARRAGKRCADGGRIRYKHTITWYG
jgi:hypothetical protein